MSRMEYYTNMKLIFDVAPKSVIFRQLKSRRHDPIDLTPIYTKTPYFNAVRMEFNIRPEGGREDTNMTGNMPVDCVWLHPI